MARLKSHDDSEDDLPDIATLLSQPLQQRNARKDPLTTTPRVVRTPGAITSRKGGTIGHDTASTLVPKPRTAESQTRRQRPLSNLQTVKSLTSPFFRPQVETASAKEETKIPTQSKLRQNIIRETPRRTAKTTVRYHAPIASSPVQSDTDDNEITWCESESEEEVDDTVIEDDFWEEPKTLQTMSRKPPPKQEDKRHAASNPISNATTSNAIKNPLSSEDYSTPQSTSSDPIKSSPKLKAFFPLPTIPSLDRPSSSSSADNDAILSFVPPPRSPHKIKTTARPLTPPSESPLKGRLASPSKSSKRIPTPPYGTSTDVFWDQLETSDWNEQHSPRKILASPRKKKFLENLYNDEDENVDGYESPSESPKKRGAVKESPVKPHKPQKETKKSFEARKRGVATAFLQELDQTITDGKIMILTEETGGVEILWNKKLTSTAGRAHWKRESVKVAADERGPDGKSWRPRHRAHIELAEKVIDDEDRLLNVLAHEFCHLANFMISGVRDNPHGKEFKAWAAKVSTAFRHRNIHVTTKHSYDISYKYVWECVSCGHEYKRHSKSIDPTKHGCGVCKSKLVQTKPAVRAGAKPSDYQLFIKENFQRVKQENPGVALGGLMETLGRQYREQKAKAEKAEPNVGTGVDDLVKGLEIITLDE